MSGHDDDWNFTGHGERAELAALEARQAAGEPELPEGWTLDRRGGPMGGRLVSLECASRGEVAWLGVVDGKPQFRLDGSAPWAAVRAFLIACIDTIDEIVAAETTPNG